MSGIQQLLTRAIAGFVLTAALVFPAFGQELKIGVVNVPALMANAPQAAAVTDALTAEFQPRQREIVAKQKELEELTEKVQRDLAVMGETERRNAEKDVRELQREVSRLQNEFQEDLNLRRNEELAKLQREILREVATYAREAGYDLVLGEGVFYASSAVDITSDVLTRLQSTSGTGE